MLFSCIQLATEQGQPKAERLRLAEQALAELGQQEQRPQQILLPELWGVGAFAFADFEAAAEPLLGETYELLAHWARRLNCYIHSGSFIERAQNRLYNTSLLINPQGRVIAEYRKIHLFGYESREPELISPGGAICTAGTEYGRVGLATCYDLRFPELFRALTNLGAEVLLVAAAWPLSRLDHWQLLSRARAVENLSLLAACNGAGTHAQVQLGGHSLIVDPWGQVLAEGGEAAASISAEADLSLITKTRAEFPALYDKRLG